MSLAIFLVSCTAAPVIRFEPDPTPYLYDSIVIEIVPQEGAEPGSQALSAFRGYLRRYDICRNVGIIVRQPATEPLLPVWNRQSIELFEGRHRTLRDKNPEDRHLVIYISYMKGNYVQGATSGIAGLKYNSTSICMFSDNFDRRNEGSILLHELGHLIDLARNRDEPDANPNRPDHCNNSNCSMYWVVGNTRGWLDADCANELQKRLEARLTR